MNHGTKPCLVQPHRPPRRFCVVGRQSMTGHWKNNYFFLSQTYILLLNTKPAVSNGWAPIHMSHLFLYKLTSRDFVDNQPRTRGKGQELSQPFSWHVCVWSPSCRFLRLPLVPVLVYLGLCQRAKSVCTTSSGRHPCMNPQPQRTHAIGLPMTKCNGNGIIALPVVWNNDGAFTELGPVSLGANAICYMVNCSVLFWSCGTVV